MGFVATRSPKYFAPAVHRMLGADGELIVSKFDCQFRRLSKTQLEALEKNINRPDADLTRVMRDREVLVDVMTGWRAVQDADAADLPFTMEQLDELEEEFIGFQKSCVESYFLSTAPTEAAHLAAKN